MMKITKKLSFSGLIAVILISTTVAHADTLTVTSQGKVIEKFDVTGKVLGDYCLRVERVMEFYFPWNGEDSVDVVIRDSVLLVNGNLAGVCRDIDLSQLPNPDSIYCLSGQIKDCSLLPGFRNLVYFEPDQASDSCLRYLQGLNQLRVLNLSQNQVSGIDLGNLSEIPNLHTLDLSYTDINDEVLETISDCYSLEKLSISNTDTTSETFTSKGLSELSALVNLRELRIWDADEIGDEEFAAICDIINLHVLLIFGGSVINDQGLKHVTKSRQIEYLTIYHNQGDITDSSIDVLADMKGLKELRLSSANFSDIGWENLSDSLPDCDIYLSDNSLRINPNAMLSTEELLEQLSKIHVSFQQW